MRRSLSGTAVLITGALVAACPTAAFADYSPSDFPSSSEVSEALETGGTWDRYVTKNSSKAGWVVGARPSRCASDRPYAAVTDRRYAYYNKLLNGPHAIRYSADVAIFKFSTKPRARAALEKIRAHVRSCPSYTEWVCTQCDGIFDVWQRMSPIRNVGDQTVAWAGKSMGNLGDRYRSAAILDRDNIIKVTVSIGGDTEGPVFPRLSPTKTEVRGLAEVAYNTLP